MPNHKTDPRYRFLRSNMYGKHISHVIVSLLDEKLCSTTIRSGHFGFMQITGVPQGCRSGNQAKFSL